MKESNITPSRPNILANGSKNWDSILIIVISFIYVLDSTHIKSPIGIEIIIALFRTAKVLSRNDLIIVFIIDGFLYGGSSSINVCLSLLFNNLDNILDISSVVNTDIIIRTIKVRDEKIEFDL